MMLGSISLMGKQILAIAALLLAAAGCSKQEAKQAQDKVQTAASNVADKVEDAIDVAVPINGKDDPAAREKERFNEEWRQLESLREAQAAQAKQQQQADAAKAQQEADAVKAVNVTFVP